MPRIAPVIPAETDLLCEACGYTLNGLPADSRCPECGRAIAESLPSHRGPSAWESRSAFLTTTRQVLFQPTRFFRSLTPRAPIKPAMAFARIHWFSSAMLMGLAAYGHMAWQYQWLIPANRHLEMIPLLIVAIYLAQEITTRLAARLTAWEAGYRGLRLPRPVVLRALAYHAAHYPPVALIVAATVALHLYLLFSPFLADLPANLSLIYLYCLSAEVIAGAVYLFWTYWIAMRNLMYANH